ncbi:hypothetical protein FXO37_05800 [Capsicum annuum]|nr:hypothetical protein FXO37_05800 [Capsicum annuum]
MQTKLSDGDEEGLPPLKPSDLFPPFRFATDPLVPIEVCDLKTLILDINTVAYNIENCPVKLNLGNDVDRIERNIASKGEIEYLHNFSDEMLTCELQGAFTDVGWKTVRAVTKFGESATSTCALENGKEYICCFERTQDPRGFKSNKVPWNVVLLACNESSMVDWIGFLDVTEERLKYNHIVDTNSPIWWTLFHSCVAGSNIKLGKIVAQRQVGSLGATVFTNKENPREDMVQQTRGSTKFTVTVGTISEILPNEIEFCNAAKNNSSNAKGKRDLIFSQGEKKQNLLMMMQMHGLENGSTFAILGESDVIEPKHKSSTIFVVGKA